MLGIGLKTASRNNQQLHSIAERQLSWSRAMAALAKFAVAGAMAALLAPASALAQDQSDGFDFYVLSLSWSPSFCASADLSKNRQQCGSSRPFGFIVHGLWPQNENGYPANCQLDSGGNRSAFVPRQILSSIFDIMPSQSLAAYQWRKHGSCSGLSQRDYFAAIRNAYERVSIPASLQNVSGSRRIDPMLVEKAFIAANPGMKPDNIAVTCNRNALQEVRICMTKDLKFRSCGEVDDKACRSRSVLMPGNR